MQKFDITSAGAFVNALEAASKSETRHREPVRPVEKPREPIVHNFVKRLIAIFVG
ncbi:MAG: hypothetical protein ACR2O3_03130 [Rhizobiaceae bacterium]